MRLIQNNQNEALISVCYITQKEVPLHTTRVMNLNGKVFFTQILAITTHGTVIFTLEITLQYHSI